MHTDGEKPLNADGRTAVCESASERPRHFSASDELIRTDDLVNMLLKEELNIESDAILQQN